ncbi:hypothetical protein GW796_10820 [archaeon]|nr:hypothetical protein [archaeon]NCQ52352.1 hypothetical protein [archaeon]
MQAINNSSSIFDAHKQMKDNREKISNFILLNLELNINNNTTKKVKI